MILEGYIMYILLEWMNIKRGEWSSASAPYSDPKVAY